MMLLLCNIQRITKTIAQIRTNIYQSSVTKYYFLTLKFCPVFWCNAEYKIINCCICPFKDHCNMKNNSGTSDFINYNGRL